MTGGQKMGVAVKLCLWAGLILTTLAGAGRADAQDNYEIQVYGAETVPPKNLMVELHSNFTVSGTRASSGSHTRQTEPIQPTMPCTRRSN